MKAIVRLLWVLCAWAVGPAAAQISPGELAKAHRPLDGVLKCLKCHDLGSGPSADKCVHCHEEIRTGIEGRYGYHFQVVSTEERSCFGCHSDHAGRDFEMILWPGGRDKFDHSNLGFDLDGKHIGVKCRECHKPEFVRSDFHASYETVDLKKTYLGLRKRCMGCHEDVHEERLGSDCESCHRTGAWREVVTTDFDHSRTRFPLQGRHADVECKKCHEARPKIERLEFGRCADCHKDEHRGQFARRRSRGRCDVCHTVGGFVPSTFTVADHAKTRFPLTGGHLALPCVACHKLVRDGHGKPFRRFVMRSVRCAVCHGDNG